jgi:hypothetical protein
MVREGTTKNQESLESQDRFPIIYREIDISHKGETQWYCNTDFTNFLIII